MKVQCSAGGEEKKIYPTSRGLPKNALFHVRLQTLGLRIGAVNLQSTILWQVVLA